MRSVARTRWPYMEKGREGWRKRGRGREVDGGGLKSLLSAEPPGYTDGWLTRGHRHKTTLLSEPDAGKSGNHTGPPTVQSIPVF